MSVAAKSKLLLPMTYWWLPSVEELAHKMALDGHTPRRLYVSPGWLAEGSLFGLSVGIVRVYVDQECEPDRFYLTEQMPEPALPSNDP